MERIIERLRQLKDEGKMVITPSFIISYNCFTDTFILDIPEWKKVLRFTVEGEEEEYNWDVSRMYPCEFDAELQYEDVWEEMQQYIQGATIEAMPSFVLDNTEMVWVDGGDDGEKAVEIDKIRVIKRDEYGKDI